jgi:hypothetical protein
LLGGKVRDSMPCYANGWFVGAKTPEQVQISEGRMAIGDLPGSGVDLDEEGIASYPYQVHNLRHYTGALTDIRPQDAATHYAGSDGARRSSGVEPGNKKPGFGARNQVSRW